MKLRVPSALNEALALMVLGLLAAMTLGVVGGALAAAVGLPLDPLPAPWRAWLLLLQGVALTLVALWAPAAWRGTDRPLRWWPALLTPAVAHLTHRLAPWLQLGTASVDELAALAASPGLVGGVVAIGAIVTAPLGEELLFRGVVYGRLVIAHGTLLAVLASSAAFGLFHMDPAHGLMAALVGLWLGLVRASGASVWPAVAGHALNNAVWWVAARGWLPEPTPVVDALAVVAILVASAVLSRS